MLKWISSRELFMVSFALLTLKNLVLPTSVGDALVFMSLSGLYGVYKFLSIEEKKVINERNKEYENFKDELKDLKSHITALSVKPISNKQPSNNGRFF